jgi:hypothetical protein
MLFQESQRIRALLENQVSSSGLKTAKSTDFYSIYSKSPKPCNPTLRRIGSGKSQVRNKSNVVEFNLPTVRFELDRAQIV